MVKCKVTEVVPLSKINENPVMVHFQNGTVQPSASDLEAALARNADGQLHAIAAQSDNVYAGRVGDAAVAGGDLLRHFIGIRNRTTNKMRLVEVEQCSMLSKHYHTDPTAVQARTTTTDQAYRIMLKTYGGKAANRMLEKSEKMKLNVDVVKEQLDRTMNESTTQGDGDVTLGENGERLDDFDVAQAEREEAMRAMVPKLNQEASRLEDVYRLGDLIEESLLQRMDSDALAVLQAEPEDLPIKAAYLLAIIKKCRESKAPESAGNLQKIKICIYVDALINFLKGLRNTRQNMKNTAFSEIAERVETDIRLKFRQPNTQKIIKSNYIQHKTICYIVILSLLASDKFELETSHIVDAIHVSKSQLYTMTTIVSVRRKPREEKLLLKLPSQLRSLTRKPFQKSSRRT